jgi:hypothetical protein
MIVTVHHSNDASVDFVTDCILYKDKTPRARECFNGIYLPVADSLEANFILLSIDQIKRRYSGCSKKEAPMYQLTLMDGSEVCFCAYLTVSLTMLLDNKDIPIGSTIIVKDHIYLPLIPTPRSNWRGALVISDMEWKVPPNYNIPSKFLRTADTSGCKRTRLSVLDEKKTVRVDSSVLDACQQHTEVVFTTPRRTQNMNGDCFLVQAKHRDIDECIVNQENRDNWKAKLYISPTTGSSCQCTYTCGTQRCLHESFPVWQIDLEEVIYTVKNLGLLDAVSFDRLSRDQQAWCLRWWYSVNYIQTCKKGTPLPKCIKDAITKFCFPENE